MANITVQGRLKVVSRWNRAGLELRCPLDLQLGSNGGCIRWIGCHPQLQEPHRSKIGRIGHSKAKIFLPSATRVGISLHQENEDEDEFDFEKDELSCFRGLVLDISYRPVNVVCWKRAICLEFMEKADVLEYYNQTVNSPSGSFHIPAVLRVPHLLQVMKRKRISNTLSRKNIFYRDDYTCQYCSSTSNLTVDHVKPIARGGQWTWENLVTACSECNSKKGQKTLKEANMTLAKTPKAPKDYDILAIPLTGDAIRMLRRKGTPEEWRQYLQK